MNLGIWERDLIMSIEEKAERGQTIYFPANAVSVCVDTKTASGFSGRVYSTMLEEGMQFRDFPELMLNLDEVFDAQGYPQAYQVKRSFLENARKPSGFCGKPPQKLSAEEVIRHKGVVATLYMVVSTRRSTSWQGEIWDSEGRKIGSFSSDLELLKLFIAALKAV